MAFLELLNRKSVHTRRGPWKDGGGDVRVLIIDVILWACVFSRRINSFHHILNH